MKFLCVYKCKRKKSLAANYFDLNANLTGSGSVTVSDTLSRVCGHKEITVCPGSLDPFHIVTCYIRLVKTSWTHSMFILDGSLENNAQVSSERGNFICDIDTAWQLKNFNVCF